MQLDAGGQGWQSLFRREWIPTLAILLGGVLLQSMNVLMLTTVLPSIAGELGGVTMLSWPTTAYLASSIVAASCAGMLAATLGARTVYCAGAMTFAVGAILCSLAPTMGFVVAGRLVQGFGGGLEAAVAYVLLRSTFPEQAWPRAIALMSTSWSMSVLIGPLVGGLFAHFGNWRGAFVTAAAAGVTLAACAFVILRPAATTRTSPRPQAPLRRVALIVLAIAAMSGTSVVASALAKAALIAAAVAALAVMLRINRTAPTRLLPSDAFSLRTQTGVGLWLALLLCITFSPLQLYMPMFLQQLHGLGPLSAGFAVASASLAWTAGSLATAGVRPPWPDRLMLMGPATMAVSLAALAVLTPRAEILPLLPAIIVLGFGIGSCWPFVAQRIMGGATEGNEVVAASSVPTVQQTGIALGAAIAGLVASVSGLSSAAADAGMARAAAWVPAAFLAWAALAFLAGVRLYRLRRS